MCRSIKSGEPRRCASCTSHAADVTRRRRRRQALAARRAVMTHLKERGLPQTAEAVLASPPSILAEFMAKFDIPTSVLGDLPMPPAGPTPASAAAALRIAWAECAAQSASPMPTQDDDTERAHLRKGRQALLHTSRPAPTRAPSRPLQPQPSTRPPMDTEAVRRVADALARAAATQSPSEAKPNCGGSNLEVIITWEEQAETVFAEGSSKAACRAANAEAEMLCKGCPLMKSCARDAKENHYTGIAGGRIFIYGRQRLTPSRADRIVA